MTTDLLKLSHSELIKKIQQLEQENSLLKQNNSLFPIKELAFNIKDIVAVMPGNIFWKTKDGVYLGCNNNLAKFLGFNSPDDIIGKRNSDFMDADVAKALDLVDQEIYASGGKYIEEQGLDQNSNVAHFLTHKIPLYDENGNIVGMFGIALDITQMKKIEQDLKIAKEKAEEISRAKSEFVANMSHDMKTPLSGMIGLAELLTYRLKARENLEFAQIIKSSGHQLLHFFDNCLEVFKLETTDIQLIEEDFNLKTLVTDIIELYQPAIKTKALALQFEYSEAVPECVKGSRAGIYRILLNLLGNAVKFTNEGSISIRITLLKKSRDDVVIQFIVCDTGIGIPQDKQSIIFDRFTRLTPSYKGIYEGSGIGLYIVQKYITSMQGKIHIQSQATKGCQFIVELPLKVSHTPISKIDTASKLNTLSYKQFATAQPIRILLVEDNLTAQLIEHALLTSLNGHVENAESGEIALALFEPGKYDLIFMDIGLPGIQGDAVAKAIRKMELGTHHHTPIIALTAHSTAEMNIDLLSAEIEEIVNKPLSRERAQEVIERYVLE